VLTYFCPFLSQENELVVPKFCWPSNEGLAFFMFGESCLAEWVLVK